MTQAGFQQQQQWKLSEMFEREIPKVQITSEQQQQQQQGTGVGVSSVGMGSVGMGSVDMGLRVDEDPGHGGDWGSANRDFASIALAPLVGSFDLGDQVVTSQRAEVDSASSVGIGGCTKSSIGSDSGSGNERNGRTQQRQEISGSGRHHHRQRLRITPLKQQTHPRRCPKAKDKARQQMGELRLASRVRLQPETAEAGDKTSAAGVITTEPAYTPAEAKVDGKVDILLSPTLAAAAMLCLPGTASPESKLSLLEPELSRTPLFRPTIGIASVVITQKTAPPSPTSAARHFVREC
jgi:hypothetical protein